jgi:hypothetical protein
MLLSFSFCGIFGFDQVGVTFRHKTLMGSELPQYAAHLDHFLKAAEQRFLRLSCMQSYIKRHIEPSFRSIAYDRLAPIRNTNSVKFSYFLLEHRAVLMTPRFSFSAAYGIASRLFGKTLKTKILVFLDAE